MKKKALGNAERAEEKPSSVMTAVKANSLIFWVEDYQGVLEGWRMLLENQGYQVLTAVDANRAMRLFISRGVDEVVLDYQYVGSDRGCYRARDEGDQARGSDPDAF
jgi:PleD family two-component response regulator